MSELDRYIVEKALKALDDLLTAHEPHTWEQIGRCVYCECGERLYQGYLPAHRRTAKKAPPEPKATTEMRKQWGKT
jgi:hypothetical protein